MRRGGWQAAMLAGGLATAAGAAQTVDPDWPCVQRKVPELSVGQMWAGPVPAAAGPEVEALAARLAPRRTSVEEVGAEAATAVRDLPAEARAERLGALFAAVLDRINAERGALIAGIGRYARRQAALAAGIEARQLELAELERAPAETRDPGRIAELRERLAWETRIYRDRAQSLTYVCETPVLLEQRAFAIARELAELL